MEIVEKKNGMRTKEEHCGAGSWLGQGVEDQEQGEILRRFDGGRKFSMI